MSRRNYSVSKKFLVATALALIASGVAIADDGSMSRFGGDGYAYFSQPVRSDAATIAAWRHDHPNGLSQRELQAASSSALAAVGSRFDDPSSLLAGVPADSSWRQSHPNGLTQRELLAAGASSLAVWQLPAGARVPAANFAEAPSKPTWLSRK